MTKKIARLLHRPRYVELAEAQSSLLQILLGLWFVAPWWDTFEVPAYAFLRQFGNEMVVGLVLIVYGLVSFCVTRSRNVFWRRAIVLGSFVVWASIAMLFLLFDTKNTGGVVYGVLALSTAWAYLHIGRSDHRC